MGNYSKKSSIKVQWPLYHTIPLPLDKDGFTKSFDILHCDPKEIKQFYDTYGVVVFDNVLTQEEIQKTIDDLWTETKAMFQTEKIKINRDDPLTWNFKGAHKKFGFVGSQPMKQPQIWQNRCNPKVYQIFKSLYSLASGQQLKQSLIACFDRGSMMRPSKLNPQWQTASIYHFDIDPWLWTGMEQEFRHNGHEEYYRMFEDFLFMLGEGNYTPNVGYPKLAGVLALSDTNEQSGGFQAALGFHNYIKKWCQKTKYMQPIQQDEQLLKTFQKVFMRRGSLLVFTRQLPHNIYPNKSENFRYAQYLRMMPESSLCLNQEEKDKRRKFISPMIPENLERNSIVKEIFMLQ